MSWLLDVNFILASRWTTHPEHLSVKAWIDSVGIFHTCPLVELGFVRVSLSVAYRATWDDVQEALKNLQARPSYRFLVDDIDGTAAPQTAAKDTTDAHLVTLARPAWFEAGHARHHACRPAMGIRRCGEPVVTASSTAKVNSVTRQCKVQNRPLFPTPANHRH